MTKYEMPPDSECSCTKCAGACTGKPGWFAPGEVEKVAEYLDVPLAELFKKKLSVDWLEGSDPRHVFLLSPGIIKKHGQVIVGTELPANPMGRCVFLKDGKCEIHPVKPMECRKYDHTQNHDTSVRTHEEVGALWNNDKSREQIEELLGREPIAEEYSFLDAITWKYS